MKMKLVAAAALVASFAAPAFAADEFYVVQTRLGPKRKLG